MQAGASASTVVAAMSAVSVRVLKPLLAMLMLGLVSPVLAQSTMSSAPPSVEPGAVTETSPEPAVEMPGAPALELSTEDDAPVPPSGPAVASADALKLFMTACTTFASGDAGATARAAESGWIAYDSEDTGPYKSVFTASQELSGLGTVELWSSVEQYPSQKLGYCRVDFGDYDNRIDFADMAGLGLTGTVAGDGANLHGAWEDADHKVMVLADRTDGETAIEFNILIGPAPAQN